VISLLERANKTLQDRLVKELWLAGVSTMEDGNAFLPTFMADYNARFAKPPFNDKDPALIAGIGTFAVIQAVAPSLGVEVVPVNVRNAHDIERGVAASARTPNGGMIVTGSALAVFHRDLIIKLAAEHKLPAVYYRRLFVTGGGLISYGPDLTDQFRKAAGYVDLIFKGETPAELPVADADQVRARDQPRST
jgi:ABC-type uncharacterized transport system substrate-binding protein